MKRKIYCICFVFTLSILLLAGCQKEEEKEVEIQNIDLKEKEAVEINDSLFEKQDLDLKVSEVSIDLEPYAEVRTCCLYNEKVFYALDYMNFYDDPMGEKGEQQFDKRHNSQIRMYDILSGEDRLVYQYNEDFCVAITDLQFNGKYLIWEDYNEYQGAWTIKCCLINEDMKLESIQSEILFKDGDVEGELSTITPLITKDSVYWYDLVKYGNYHSVMYRYDLEQKEISIHRERLDTYSPYMHISLEEDTLLTYRYKDDYSTIFMEEGNDCITIDTLGKVEELKGNNRICAWNTAENEREKVFLYDVVKNEYYYIPCNYVFSFSVYDNVIIINKLDGIYAYDIENKTYMSIKESDSTYCNYIYDGIDCRYALVREYDESRFVLLIIK